MDPNFKPHSYSTIGKTADAASVQQSHKSTHAHKTKVHLKPWDGLELVDKILLDARKSYESNPRAQVCLSSPRVNPAMVEKVFVEETSSKMAKFLSATATSLAELPAHKSILRSGSEEESEGDAHVPNQPFQFRKRKSKKVRPKPSAAFLAPARRGPEEPTIGPPVGKYQPKFSCIERRSATPAIPRADNGGQHHHHHQQPQHNHSQPAQTAGDISRADSPVSQHSNHHHDDTSFAGSQSIKSVERAGSVAQQTAAAAAGAGEADKYREAHPRKYTLQDTSSAFKSTVGRWSPKPALDLCYYPYTYPGQTTYVQGTFHGNARERSYTPYGKPCGAPVNYPQPDVRPHSSLDFDRIVPREKLKTRALFPPVDTSQIDHDPNVSGLSTKPRMPQPLPMSKQTSRPKTKQPNPTEELDPYRNSIATSKKKGFVDIRRMVYNHLAPPFEGEDEFPARPASVATADDYSMVHAQSPKYSFAKSGRAEIVPKEVVDLTYDADDASVRRHRPACFMPKSERETIVMKKMNDSVYDVHDVAHTVTCNIGKQISRDVRDKRFASS